MIFLISDNEYHVTFCSNHYGHKCDPADMRLPSATIERILFLGRLGCSYDKIYRKIRSENPGIDANTFITIDQVKYYLKRDDQTVLSSDDLLNIDLLVKQDGEHDNKSRQFIGYKPRNLSLSKYPLLSKEQFFLVIMNDFKIQMVKEFELFNEKVITMDATFSS